MALNIKNIEVERLVEEMVHVTGESKTEAILRSLDDRKRNLSLRLVTPDPAKRFRRFLEEEAWPLVPVEEKGRTMSRTEEDALLGYGMDGV